MEFRNDCNYWIKGSKAEFSQVILNLLANSQNALIKKSANNRWIEIDYEKSKNELKISVSDNGGGITIEPIESIFHPYISSGNNKNGAGLGLYIARNLIHRLGGNIYVNNSKDGAIFHINFPLYSQSHIHS